ncbi:MAG: LEA type 2 family protein [Spirochaetia bacterium]
MKRFALLAGLAAALMGCASQRPMVTVQPTVSVSNFESLSFSPQRIEFDATVLIQNNAPVDLDVQKVDWAADMYDQQLFTDSLTGFNQTNAHGSRTISLPFHIAMKDVMAQAPDLLAEGRLKVTIRGQVFTAARYGLEPVPFTQTLEIPIIKLPDVAYVGSDGEPFSNAFRLNFKLTNTNDFPITLLSVRTFLAINEKRYSLLHTQGSVDIPPGQTLPVALQMENSPGKTLSMALNLAQHPNPSFSVNGTATFKTPYGFIYIPLSLEEILQ